MTLEGWDGKSIKQHVENAGSDAAAARELAESAHDELATIRAELIELKAVFCKAAAEEDGVPAEDGKLLEYRQALFAKTASIHDEIGSFEIFILEAEEVRTALQEWRRLGLGPNGAFK